MTTLTITPKATALLNAIATGLATREEVASHLNVTIPVVNGSLTSLKRNGLIEIDEEDGALSLTADAMQFVTVKQRKAAGAPRAKREGTKMAQAREVFNKLFKRGRQVVLTAFQEQVGLTKNGAVTYFQNLRNQAGLVNGVAFSKKAPKIRKPAAAKAK